MKSPSDSGKNQEELWKTLIGLGEQSARKSYYPELQQRLAELERFRTLLDNSNDLIFLLEVPSGKIIDVNESACRQLDCSRRTLLGRTLFDCTGVGSNRELEQIVSADHPAELGRKLECSLRTGTGRQFPTEITLSRMMFNDGEYVAAIARDITERKRAEAIIQGRLDSLIRPESDTVGLAFEHLFDLEDIQKIQDAFARATGVASIITDNEGRPLTRPSNFCRLCEDIIRKTDAGLTNCMYSDRVLRHVDPEAPMMQPCLCGGLWAGGAGIMVGDRHIANWLIGQVRDEQQDEAELLAYGRKIGADDEEFRAALDEVTVMSSEQFSQVCEALFIMARQLSTLAYQNVQQARSIHERDEIAEALRESEEKFRLLLNSTAEAIYGLDTEGSCIFCNPACLKMLGYARESELLGKNMHNLIHYLRPDGTAYPGEECRVHQAFKKGEGVHADAEILRRADGSDFVAEYWSYPVRKGNEVIGAVVTFLDITERKKAEEALRESDRIKTEFVKTVAHEFRTPLTVIQGFSELLLTHDHISRKEREESLRYIYERSFHLADMVDDMLDIARIESGEPISLKWSPCPVADIFRQVGPFLKILPSPHPLEIDLAEEDTLLNVDKGKLVEVLENLLSNAFKFSRDGSPVRIRGEVDGAYYRISVADQGIGMTPEQMAKAFDKFYRADASDTAVAGVGLGMSIVKHIVEAHGGKIWMESEVGRGTTVRFTLPLIVGSGVETEAQACGAKDPAC
ncbi:MAG TPA: PocR ligand-binding domain-containing protein [Geopsychrobacteraceae bacterium]